MLAGADDVAGEVAVAGLDAVAVVDLDEVAVAAIVPLGAVDNAVGGRVDRSADRAGEIDSRVHGGAAPERIGADSEAGGEVDRLLDRNGRGNGDRPLLELLELLPAHEQSLEIGVCGAGRRHRLVVAAHAAFDHPLGLEAETANL